nr:T9SS type A sorting domain-containing protein [Saprospiraceae bacterium]
NLSINGQNYALDTTNTGFLVSGISNSDSLLVYHLCNLVPGISACFDFTFVNPCFIVATDDTKIDDYLQVSIVGGTYISVKNKYTTDLPISMYSIDGQSITSEIIVSPSSTTEIDISRWPNGVYILKSQIFGNQVAKKLVNVR